MSLEDVSDPENAHFVVEGKGDSALKIYVCSGQNKREYLELGVHGALNGAGLNRIEDDAADSPITVAIN